MIQLDARAEEVQRLLGVHHRHLVAQFVAEQYAASVGPGETCGVFLSGGIDSGSLMFSIIEDCGLPVADAYTAVIEKPDGSGGFIESKDYRRAKAICDYYGVNHHAVVMPRDPDWACSRMLSYTQMSTPDSWMSTRADFEVSVMYFTCADKAAEQGNSALFSGTADAGIHLDGRRPSVANKNRDTMYGSYRSTMQTLSNLSLVPGQTVALSDHCRELGLVFNKPHAAVAAQHPYLYVPWRLLNRPRDKWISVQAYADEYFKTTGSVTPNAMAMQTGDSGAREYFDDMVRLSGIPDEVCGKEVTTSKVFTNELARMSQDYGRTQASRFGDDFPYVKDLDFPDNAVRDHQEHVNDIELDRFMMKNYGDGESMLRWMDHLLCGGGSEPPKIGVTIDPETHRSTLDYFHPAKIANPDLPLSGVAGREHVYTDDEGKIDSRIDCLGQPLHRGPAFALTMCPRAQAGLCGKATRETDPDAPELHRCEVLDLWASESSRFIWDSPVESEEAGDVYKEWSASSTEVTLMMKAGVASFIRDQENLYL